MLDLQNCCSKAHFSLCNGAFLSFISLLLSLNHLQKGDKLAKGVNKLLGKVLINLLHHAKSADSIISIIIDASVIAYAKVCS